MNNKRWIRYGVCVLAGVVLFLVSAGSKNLFSITGTQEVLGALSDSFLLPGAFFTGIGALSWIGAQGTFDMLSYAVHMIYYRFSHPREAVESFYDYKMKKDESRKGWLVHLLVTGLLFMGISVIFLILYCIWE